MTVRNRIPARAGTLSRYPPWVVASRAAGPMQSADAHHIACSTKGTGLSTSTMRLTVTRAVRSIGSLAWVDRTLTGRGGQIGDASQLLLSGHLKCEELSLDIPDQLLEPVIKLG